LRLAFVVAHAAAGLGAFAVGLVALRPRRATTQPWLLPTLLWLVVIMVVFAAAAVATHWDELEPAAQGAFGALIGLGLYTIHRARGARRSSDASSSQDRRRFVDDVGFVLIALFDGFVIVAAIDLGAPPWVVAFLAVAAVVVGHRQLARTP